MFSFIGISDIWIFDLYGPIEDILPIKREKIES